MRQTDRRLDVQSEKPIHLNLGHREFCSNEGSSNERS